ncbi:MAG: hypothetical protein IPH04_20560 [Saprospirales bacterium]|nr:hypothetical protein [Saprospirales bacterium]
MIQKFFLPLFLFLSAWSCNQPAGEVGSDSPKTEDPVEQLKDKAVAEGDIYGRLQASVVVLQEEFTRSESSMPGLKQVKVAIDANCILSISNKAFGNEETRVSLRDLDPNGFGLLPDLNEGDFPGLSIRTLGGKEGVELWKDGTRVHQKTELAIHLANREAIGRITPYMLQAINICQGVQYPD